MNSNKLSIDMDILQKRKEIPIKLAELSYKDSKLAIKYMREWGERRIPITVLHEKLCSVLN